MGYIEVFLWYLSVIFFYVIMNVYFVVEFDVLWDGLRAFARVLTDFAFATTKMMMMMSENYDDGYDIDFDGNDLSLVGVGKLNFFLCLIGNEIDFEIVAFADVDVFVA